MNKFKHVLLIGLALVLSGCNMAILSPRGIIAASEKHILVDATLLMLIVVVPVIVLSFVFAWKYREQNTNAKYTPEWSHSNLLEAIWWAIPCVIILILAIITWISSHKLDPYRPLDVKKQPIAIQAISLNWKWLFIYPKQHIATVNYVQIPVDVPIRFFITSDAPMNSLEIPRLAGQIYAMAGMQTKLNLMASAPGNYTGLSTSFSGNGFSTMNFVVKAGSQQAFKQWVKKVQYSPKTLSFAAYNHLVKPSENVPVEYFSQPAEQLFHKVIAKYMRPGVKMANSSNHPVKLSEK